MTTFQLRIIYVSAALAAIAVGLAVHLGGGPLSPAARDVAGDAMWAMMFTWWISALGPRLPRSARGALALAICYAVELSQLYHTPRLDELRRSMLGQLVLGSAFDFRDLAAYAAGVLAAVVIDFTAASRSRVSRSR